MFGIENVDQLAYGAWLGSTDLGRRLATLGSSRTLRRILINGASLCGVSLPALFCLALITKASKQHSTGYFVQET